MSPEAWARARQGFERARELDPAARERFLQELGDPGLAREVRALLTADASTDSLLDEDVLALQAEVLGAEEERIGVGSLLGDLRLVEWLGEGGSAHVFRATRAGPDQGSVAVKVLKAEASSPGVLSRFEQEREALAGLEHPGLIRVLDAGQLEDGRPYLVTEHVRGVPIDRYCDEHGLDRGARLRLFIAVCEAVHHAHQHLVVHRDLKPSNILVTPEGAPKVLDFGIAKLLDPARDPQWTDVYGRGPLTLACASPEQVREEPVTTASDVYALGVLLYRLTTGASPYRAGEGERAALIRAVTDEPPRPPREAARAAGREPPPADLETILACALRKAPEERYPSVEHLAEDLRRFLEHRPPLARREPWMRRTLRLVRRHPLGVGVLVAAVLLLVGGWIGARRSLVRVRASEGIAWRAHANAVRSTSLLAGLLERVASRSQTTPDDLRAVLAEAETNLASLLDAPEAEGRMRLALASAERALGQRAKARAHLERTLALSLAHPGFSWRDSARCLELLAELALEDGDGARALAHAERRTRLASAEKGQDSEDAALARAFEDGVRRRLASPAR